MVHASSAPGAGGESIRSFRSTIYINPDGSITVKESITVESLGRRIRHGIYRELPVRYRTRLGSVIDSRFRVLSVRIDGEPGQWHMKKQDAFNVRIYMGSRARLLSPGEHTFELTYQMERMIRFFHDYDELYWNVTGDRWEFPIQWARVEIVLPFKGGFLQYSLYTGPIGSRESNARIVKDSSRRLAAETTVVLPPGHGFTIAAAFPKGMVKEPSITQKIAQFFMDNRAFLAGTAGLMVVLAYYFVVWFRAGRDPRPGNIIPLFQPPEGMGPAAARYIYRMGYDNRVLTAALVNMAVKGAIKIQEWPAVYVIKKALQGMAPSGLTAAEERLFNALFSSATSMSLSSKNASRIKKAVEKLKKGLRQEYEKVYFLTNRMYLIPGVIISVMVLLLMAILSQDVPTALFMTIWLSVWAPVSLTIIAAFAAAAQEFFRRPTLRSVRTVLLTGLFAAAFGGGLVMGSYAYGSSAGFNLLAIFLLLVLANMAFYHLMKAPTMKGRRVMDKLEGFKLYLKTAEEERLGILTPPEKTPELFEKYLPWAIALGVENEWSKKFETVLKEAIAAGTYRPAWYSGPGTFSPGSISAMGAGISSALSAATFSGRSGSGGGGFSGGGGGGGGGGGW